MSRTYRTNYYDSCSFRHPRTMNERRQLAGLKADAKMNDYNISPINRLSRHIPDEWDDLRIASYAETFWDDRCKPFAC